MLAFHRYSSIILDMSGPNILYAEKTAEFFAQALDKPWIVKQERLDDLREYTDASENPDFNLATHLDSEGNVANTARLYSLPFRLSLGLHVSVNPEVEAELTDTFYRVYKMTEPLHPVKFTLRTDPKTQKKERAERAVAGAILGAATDGMPTERVKEGLAYSKKQKLLVGVHATMISHALTLLHAI